jgi:hypothetical protein
MKTIITLAEGKASKRINLSLFEKKARTIFAKEVSVQIKKAKSTQHTSSAVKCNNPV